jgi:WD40 repeat protein
MARARSQSTLARAAVKGHPVLAAEFDTAGWEVSNLVFSPNSKWLIVAAGQHDTAIIETGTWKSLTVLKPTFPVERIVFAPNGESFLCATFKDEPLRCWNTTAALRWTLDPGSMDASFSPDGTMLAATRNKSVLFCGAARGNLLHQMPGHKSRVDLVAFSPDGRRVASVGQSQVCLWDARSAQLVSVVQEKKCEIHVVSFSRDGCLLAVAGSKGVIALYETVSGKQQHEWQAHGCHIWRLAFSWDSTRLLSRSSIGSDESLRLWELPACRQVSAFPNPLAWEITPGHQSAALSVGTSVEIRSLSSWQLEAQIQLKLPSPISIFTFSPDGFWLACVLKDGNTQVWRIVGSLPANH